MTPENQADALKVIENLRTHSTTNLWHGITKGLKLLADAEPVHQNTQSLFILTDGTSKSRRRKSVRVELH